MMQKLTKAAMLIGFLIGCAHAQTTATIEGSVVIADPDGRRVAVPGAKISLAGPAYIAAESNAEGKFAIKGIPAGSYEITARVPGLTADRSIEVIAGTVLEVTLWMKVEPAEVSAMVTTEQPSLKFAVRACKILYIVRGDQWLHQREELAPI